MMTHQNLANVVSRFLNEGVLDQEILNNVKSIPKKERTKLKFLSSYVLSQIQKISDNVQQLTCIDAIQEAKKSLLQHSDVKV